MAIYEVELYTPHSAQLVFHRCTARFICMNCGRRFGKTVASANEMCKFACECDNTLSWWVAPTYKQARIAFRMMKKALQPLLTRSSENELRLELINGAVIECRSADKPDNLRGEGVHFMVLEEAAMLPAVLWYEVLRPMLSDTNGRAVFISTPKGRNWFYTIFQRGLDPEYPEYASFTFPTSANPYVPQEEIEAARRDMPEDSFRQEYLAVFLEESAGVFRNIDKCIYGDYREEEPLADHMYFAGWDVAKYLDFSVLTILDAMTRRVVYWWRSNKIDYTFQMDEVEGAIRKYGAYLLQDVTGVGDPIFEQMQKRDLTVQPYLFTNASKEALVKHLQLDFQNQSIGIPNIEVMLAELRQFEYKFNPTTRTITYGAPDGAHDDTVISLALSSYAAGKPSIPLIGDDKPKPKPPIQLEEVELHIEEDRRDPFAYAERHGYYDY